MAEAIARAGSCRNITKTLHNKLCNAISSATNSAISSANRSAISSAIGIAVSSAHLIQPQIILTIFLVSSNIFFLSE
jgi:hypothetical protein